MQLKVRHARIKRCVGRLLEPKDTNKTYNNKTNKTYNKGLACSHGIIIRLLNSYCFSQKQVKRCMRKLKEFPAIQPSTDTPGIHLDCS